MSVRRRVIAGVLVAVLGLALNLMIFVVVSASEYQAALEKSADYLVSIQDAAGFWSKKPGGSWDAGAENATGNAITTLLEAYSTLGTETYKTAGIAGGDFLISEFIQPDGSFDINKPAHHTVGDAYLNHMSPFLTAWLRLYQVTSVQKYLDAGTAFGDYLLTNGARCTDTGDPYYGLFGYLIRPTDYASRGCFTSPAKLYHGHYLNYGYEQIYGLALLSQITGNNDYLEAAELGAGQELSRQRVDGSFPAEMQPSIPPSDPNLRLGIHYASVKALAYLKLYDITSNTIYKNATVNYIDWLLTQQNPDNSFGNPDYVRSTTWAAVALLGAYKLTGNGDYLAAANKAVSWLLALGHGYDSSTGAVGRYSESSTVYIAYSQTPFALTMAEAEADIPTEVWVNATTGNDGNPGTEAEPFATIQRGIDAVAGSTVYVAGGTYNESVTIDKDYLTIHGDMASRPLITGGLKLDTNLTGLTLENCYISGNAVVSKNSIVRMYGAITDLTVDNCVFDGGNVSGRCGFSGGQLEGNVTIQNCEFKNILGWALFESRSGSGGDGSAMGTITFANNYIHDSNGSVVFRGLSTDRADLVNVYGNTWERIGGANGEQGQHWAGLEVNRSQVVNIYSNDVSNVLEGQWGEGQGFQLWNIDTLSLHHNNVTANFEGIFVYGGGGTFSIPGGSLRYNNISGNTEYGVKVDTTATGGPLDAALNWWGSGNGPIADANDDGTPEYNGGGDKAIGNIIYSPWLGIDPDGDAGTVGVQLVSPMTIIVDEVGPAPAAGYLNTAIAAANSADLPGTDTIEVRHGTYDASEPITQPVNIISETGSASQTTLNENMTLGSGGILIGQPLQGFTISGNLTVQDLVDASTIHIHWNNLYGNVDNNGRRPLDARYNFWGTQRMNVIRGRITGPVRVNPFLPKNADGSYTDIQAMLDAGLVPSLNAAIDHLWTMMGLGVDVATYIQFQPLMGGGAFAGWQALANPGVGMGAGAGGTILNNQIAGGGGAFLGVTIDAIYTQGETIEGGFVLTDPLTGDFITDAVVTLSVVQVNDDGSTSLVHWGMITYDEGTGQYVFDFDTSGLAPGVYDLLIQTDDGQSFQLRVEVTEP
ncbi:MAG: hypothetical protein AMJ46_14260 [Latescibacteria bacterium DG_63]|nr:MAG: hypothetical protein AMJ46_14260 [Latescibacteria bacterium DG_63]